MDAGRKPPLLRQSRRNRVARDPQVAKTATSASHTVTLIGGWRISGASDDSADARIRAIAERQRGRVSRAQLLASGLKHDAIVRRLRNGRLVRVHHGVYGLPNFLSCSPNWSANRVQFFRRAIARRRRSKLRQCLHISENGKCYLAPMRHRLSRTEDCGAHARGQ